MKLILKRAWTAWLLVPVLFSCATYNRSMESYYADIKSHDYTKAMRSIEKNKLIKKDRNALLYNLEMGKLYRLQNDFVNSNIYLNRADGMMESARKDLKDVALGNLLNPMHTTYRGEDFEQFMVHYYKALNYASLGQTEDAVVEARRITLSNNAQGDKFGGKASRYSNDAFALNLQGIIYEMAGDMNNAFIAYRNAVDVYAKSNNEYYGVKMPLQLQKDLLRSAAFMGFTSEQNRYAGMFNLNAADTVSENGEVILFLEEGQAPVKEERNFFLTTGSGGLGSFNYVDANGYNSNFNFDYNAYGISETKLTDLRTFRLALPVYSVQYAQPQSITVSNNGAVYTPQLAQNMNSVAVNILKERFLTEMANALARQLTKKLVEKGTQAAAESIAKKDDDKKKDDGKSDEEKEKQKKKNEEKAKLAGDAAGLVMNLFNTVTEKADTRNWQSLPAFVSYVRIPLAAGENNITVNYNGRPVTVKVNSGKGLQMTGVVLD